MSDDQQSWPARTAEALLEPLMRSGIDGAGPLDSAAEVAAKARAATGDDESAIDRIIRDHVRLAASEGFVTGLGGFITMTVALPANVVAFHVLATRMVAAIATVRGHDPTSDRVRTAVLLVLAREDAHDILRKVGVRGGTGRLTSFALRGLPPSVLMAVNKGVAFRLLVQVGEKSLTRFGRFLPGVGGLIGGGLDALLMRGLGRRAREEFEATDVASRVDSS
ncbi:MAG TPA: EcsC family protein [Euzebyales bacterium]|nr:EcsC family protein [Euzebyales bacterium]